MPCTALNSLPPNRGNGDQDHIPPRTSTGGKMWKTKGFKTLEMEEVSLFLYLSGLQSKPALVSKPWKISPALEKVGVVFVALSELSNIAA